MGGSNPFDECSNLSAPASEPLAQVVNAADCKSAYAGSNPAGYPLLKSSDKLHPKVKMPRIYTVERLMSAFEMNADDAFKAHRKRLLVTAIEK